LRFLVQSNSGHELTRAVLYGASRRLGRSLRSLRDLPQSVVSLPPEDQYLCATGRTYFKGLAFDDLRRTKFDLETTGLNPEFDRVFLIALRTPSGDTETLEVTSDDDAAETDLIRRFVRRIVELDPDVLENHNLHGFDLPFLERRAQLLRVPLELG